MFFKYISGESSNLKPTIEKTSNVEKIQPSSATISLLSSFRFPLKTVEEFNSLEQVLRANAEFRKEFVTSFAKLEYTRNKRSKFDFGFAVADAIIERELLAKYSWVGNTDRRYKKLSFVEYEEFIKVFCDILSTRNKKNTKSMTLFYLKNGLLQYSKRRYDQQLKQ